MVGVPFVKACHEIAGLGIVAILWLGFLRNYPVIRDVQFTVTMAHVLAKVTFLLRVL